MCEDCEKLRAERDRALCGQRFFKKENDRLAGLVDHTQREVGRLRDAIVHFFTPGPGIAVPARHENPIDAHDKTWNEKLDRLEAALAPAVEGKETAADAAEYNPVTGKFDGGRFS